jgi:hypothetical protein
MHDDVSLGPLESAELDNAELDPLLEEERDRLLAAIPAISDSERARILLLEPDVAVNCLRFYENISAALNGMLNRGDIDEDGKQKIIALPLNEARMEIMRINRSKNDPDDFM